LLFSVHYVFIAKKSKEKDIALILTLLRIILAVFNPKGLFEGAAVTIKRAKSRDLDLTQKNQGLCC
jgi:hypothetical protein